MLDGTGSTLLVPCVTRSWGLVVPLNVKKIIPLGIPLAFAGAFFLFTENAQLHATDAAKAQAWVGAKILNGKGETFESAVLVVKEGKIVAVGPADRVMIPEDAEKVDVSGKVIIPGIVDTHSHLGVGSRPNVPSNADVNEMTNPVESGVRALDALNPNDPGIQMALAGGVTSANVMPGSGNVIGGQTVDSSLYGKS